MTTTYRETLLPVGCDTDGEIAIEYRTPWSCRCFGEGRAFGREVPAHLRVRSEHHDYALVVLAQS